MFDPIITTLTLAGGLGALVIGVIPYAIKGLLF
ncbi:hypothetical protein J2W54_001603 [Rhodococcus fascians]|jgi:hypothetical protein|nr:hypothetical protein [Rhodococcus fascians]MDR6910127.1 hypothetical protein [Rhodococcus sp. 3258]MDR6931227.1 hypothetical protein [Rhodococcus fascians]CAH0126332.1 hypothetical protein SRABI91_00085 [Rhodococcus fascians]